MVCRSSDDRMIEQLATDASTAQLGRDVQILDFPRAFDCIIVT